MVAPTAVRERCERAEVRRECSPNPARADAIRPYSGAVRIRRKKHTRIGALCRVVEDADPYDENRDQPSEATNKPLIHWIRGSFNREENIKKRSGRKQINKDRWYPSA